MTSTNKWTISMNLNQDEVNRLSPKRVLRSRAKLIQRPRRSCRGSGLREIVRCRHRRRSVSKFRENGKLREPALAFELDQGSLEAARKPGIRIQSPLDMQTLCYKAKSHSNLSLAKNERDSRHSNKSIFDYTRMDWAYFLNLRGVLQ